MLMFLIERLHIDPNLKGRQGMTAVHHAARSGKILALVRMHRALLLWYMRLLTEYYPFLDLSIEYPEH